MVLDLQHVGFEHLSFLFLQKTRWTNQVFLGFHNNVRIQKWTHDNSQSVILQSYLDLSNCSLLYPCSSPSCNNCQILTIAQSSIYNLSRHFLTQSCHRTGIYAIKWYIFLLKTPTGLHENNRFFVNKMHPTVLVLDWTVLANCFFRAIISGCDKNN